MSGRPQFFTIDPSHQLARGLVFAGLGCAPGSNMYNDSSLYRHKSYFNTTAYSSAYSSTVNRISVEFSGSRTGYFNGILIPNHNILDLSYGMTLSAWVRPTANWYGGSNDVAISAIGRSAYPLNPAAHTAYGIGLYHGNSHNCKIRIALSDYLGSHFHTELVSSVNFNTLDGKWFHISVTHDNIIARFYRNAVAEGTGSFPYPITYYSKSDIVIGGFAAVNWNMHECWDGGLADIMVHNRVLSESELQQLANPANYMLSGLIKPIGQASNIYDLEGIR